MEHEARARLCQPIGLCCTLLLVLCSATAAGQTDPEARAEKRGRAYVGAFFVTNLDTSLNIFSQDLPLGGRVDISRQLGFKSSLTVPRGNVAWRFGKRHVLGFGWYDLKREGTRTLSAEIELPDQTIPIDASVTSFFRTAVYRLSYTWLFHNDPKVKLGFGAGLFVSRLEAGIRAEAVFVEEAAEQSVTAPLPVVGGRLIYNVTPKLGVLLNTDWFFLNYNEYQGVLLDTILFADHRTFKHVGFGGGINLQTINVEVDAEDILVQLDASYVGFLAVVSFHF